MKNFRCLSLAGLLLVAAISLQAQHRVTMNVNYSFNVPTGNFNEYLNKTSYRGWTANVMYQLNEKIAVGATTGFQDFYEKTDRALYKNADGSNISAVVTNSIQTIPLLGTVHYALTPSQTIRPFVGLGVGGSMVMHNQYLGQFASNNNKLAFAARPELGVVIPVRKGGEAGLKVAGAFNYIAYNEDGLKNLNSWGVIIGAKFPLR